MLAFRSNLCLIIITLCFIAILILYDQPHYPLGKTLIMITDLILAIASIKGGQWSTENYISKKEKQQ